MNLINSLISICVACIFSNSLVWHIPIVTPISCIGIFVLIALGITIEDNRRDNVENLEKEINNLKKEMKKLKKHI